MEERYEFDDVTLLSAVAMGQPGKRTFFLLIGSKDKWVRVWLEKYLLESLAMAIDEFLSTLSAEHVDIRRGDADAPLSKSVPPGFPSVELEVDEIAMGFDRQQATLSLSVHGVGPKREERAELNCKVPLSHLESLGKQAEKICDAGRPMCPVCGGPIDAAGHTCPGSN